MNLWELRSAEAGALGADVVAVIPIGAVEQHAAHLPLGTDSLIAGFVATGLERALPAQVLLLPTVWVGASDHHLAMPGTLSVGTVSIADTVTRMALALAQTTAIRRIVILNGHGGNQPAVRLALEQIGRADASVRAFGADYWELMFSVLERAGTPHTEGMGHADVIETSILLAERPDLVRPDLATADGYDDGMPRGVYTTLGIPERTRGGGVGDPSDASAERGRMYLDAAVRGARELIEFAQRA